jgi:hypothetical protein
MRKRPLAVTVIAWVVTVLGCLSLLGSTLWLLSWWQVPRPPEQIWQLALCFLGAGITMACGRFLLRGANWARWLYLAWMAVQWVPFLTQSHPASWIIALNLAIDLVIVACLFNPKANAYFQPRRLSEG